MLCQALGPGFAPGSGDAESPMRRLDESRVEGLEKSLAVVVPESKPGLSVSGPAGPRTSAAERSSLLAMAKSDRARVLGRLLQKVGINRN